MVDALGGATLKNGSWLRVDGNVCSRNKRMGVKVQSCCLIAGQLKVVREGNRMLDYERGSLSMALIVIFVLLVNFRISI